MLHFMFKPKRSNPNTCAACGCFFFTGQLWISNMTGHLCLPDLRVLGIDWRNLVDDFRYLSQPLMSPSMNSALASVKAR